MLVRWLKGIVLMTAWIIAAGCGGATAEQDAFAHTDGVVFDIVHSEVDAQHQDGADIPAGADHAASDQAAPDPASDTTSDPADDPSLDSFVDASLDPATDVTDEPLPDAALADPGIDTSHTEPGLTLPRAIYAHTSSELFVWDASTNPPIKIGNFVFPNDGLDHTMTDMAIDYDGHLYGVTFGGLYHCMADTARCLNMASFNEQFNGMTIVPEGTIQSGKETIIAISNAGGWYRVEVVGAKAVLTHQGNYGSGYTSAGDAYSIRDHGTWAAVNGSGGGTLLVTVEPVSGKALQELGTIPGENISGLAGYADKVYAFDSSGTIYIGDVSGAATFQPYVTTSHTWYGAAVSTRDP